MKKALLQLHIAIFLAGFTAILGRLISLGEAALVWWRLVITIIVLGAFIAIAQKKQHYQRTLVLQAIAIGAVVGLHWLCFFGSVKFANVSIALVCFSASGFFVAVLEPLILRRRFSGSELGLGILSICGVYIIFHFDTRYKTGIVMGVIAALLSALFSIFNKRLVRQMDDINMTFYEMGGALLMLSLLLPFYIGFSNAAFWPLQWDWLWLVILAVLCTVWAFVLQLKALQHVSAFTLSLSYNLEPVYGIVLAFIIFHENKYLGPAFYAGGMLIIFSLILQMLMLRRKHRTASVVK